MANARLNVTDLDFDQIKSNLKTYLQQQTTFQDYDFEGSGLSVLLDILAYNTHYNAYYLNMVANEAFLDTALLRDSVVSHAKTLGYVPHSTRAAKATINLTADSGNTAPGTLTITRGTGFSSNLLDGSSYSFVVLEDVSVDKIGTQFYFDSLDIYEGVLANYDFTYTQQSNPKAVFTLPEENIDTTTIFVSVRPNSGNSFSQVYTKSTDVLDVTADSLVYFLQESRNNQYQIYFGDNVLGKALNDGAIVSVSYLITTGPAANKSNAFVADSTIGGISNITINVVNVASGGSLRESVDSIKFGAPAQFTTQNRLVTFKDYETYLIKNYPSVDSLSVWGGEDETPPVYGKVFISLKPKENYYISEAEKQRIIDEIVTPKSIVSVAAEIIDPKYLYLLVDNYVQYDKNKTSQNPEAIKSAIKNAILLYNQTNLNKFGATFVLSKLQDVVDAVSLESIRGSETILRLQKRFAPELNVSKTYQIEFNAELHRGTTTNRLASSEFDVFDSLGVRRTAQLEEVPNSYTGVTEINVTNPGFGYTTAPTVTIIGDGTGATATATVINGRIQKITVVNRGTDYTTALVTLSGGNGYGASAVAVLDSRFGTLRTVYYDTFAQKQIIRENAGTVDYQKGLVTLNDIRFLSVKPSDGLIRISLESEKGIISSVKNTLITIDETDPASIVTELVSI